MAHSWLDVEGVGNDSRSAADSFRRFFISVTFASDSASFGGGDDFFQDTFSFFVPLVLILYDFSSSSPYYFRETGHLCIRQ
jgi:hypothetical protein